ncbi:hypothetical protein Gohar_027059, partial [Gossypium harknessii]|nr:hypothetical protein [Gossypium harknessii]
MGGSFKVERLQAEWDQIYALEESINVVNTLNIANAILKTGYASLANRIRNRRVDITIMGHRIDDLFNSNDMLHNAKFKWANRNCNKATNFMNKYAITNNSPDYTTLVYKGCAKQSFTDPAGIYSQALSALFQTLLSQSMKVKFYKTTTGTGQTTITGLFQCRGDLSNSDCYSCASRLPTLADKLCGKTLAARIQLYGCYMLYEVAGFAQISGMEMLFKTCGATNVAGTGFEERRDTAFSVLESG